VVFRHARKLGFEGIVSKRLGPPYISGRARTWLKFYLLAEVVWREAIARWSDATVILRQARRPFAGFRASLRTRGENRTSGMKHSPKRDFVAL